MKGAGRRGQAHGEAGKGAWARATAGRGGEELAGGHGAWAPGVGEEQGGTLVRRAVVAYSTGGVPGAGR